VHCDVLFEFTHVANLLFSYRLIAAVAQQSFKCPDDFGFYPHETSCDKYWKCDNGVSELKTCGNGLAFDATDSKFLTENCDYLHNVDCGERTELGKCLEIILHIKETTANANLYIHMYIYRATNYHTSLFSLVWHFP